MQVVSRQIKNNLKNKLTCCNNNNNNNNNNNGDGLVHNK